LSLVSVIIPSFNNAQWLPDCIESCLKQEFLKEIILVDNGSTDGSLDLIQEYVSNYPETVFFYPNPQKGANSSRNLGFSKSSGEYIQWLDSDDRLLAGKFSAQIAVLKATSGDVAYSDWQMDYYNETSRVFERSEFKKNDSYPDFLFEILQNKRWSSPNTYLFARKMATRLHDFHGWNPNTIVEQDREYVTLAAIFGAKFVYVPGNFAVYNRWSAGTISKMGFDQRLMHSSALAQSFIRKIDESNLPKKSTYISVLKTELLVSHQYNPNVPINIPISLKEVYWPMVHLKLRIPIFFNMLFKKRSA